ncbi:MAG: GH13_30 / GH13_23 / GH13_17 / GH13_40 / GH13_ 31 / GH13 / GH13_29 / GH13_36 / GH13_16 / GH13_35 / G H13_20 / GH13_4 / GH13_2 / GH13_1 / GH13_21 / GH13 _19 / GH13_37 / GH13_26 / GH13_34 [uncultured Nocardioides sp.]|uniref:GH13_30 / GH13_23 / GH13_17 / GH13_40 / GH13_ 31 / GH13 / GH13_29 / GH13_36 / GH13_16 / GH13_35 / G H13_20 / GH13_4 / GH13_2 / GH13_1 / GH13_21 / GH13 _19 / GH13_37 / GH13_26 / GH13_34 n=1 Tax=uncultured Nocardioides sp. TaxID=198441 RepID=A0A6J4P2G4_9ACTN|nr:MAG: GH13_30 / GH13_23 / GH13_17 / GH13_40 / GH13_ 31 / GH13 / GH13_29 / GH13_36 / GH13_16 / GH13_35 / G H13_20 / GH13_4 / GH13_2 / GH13_1 / GH13_21 / GH13 _19 / GH13_37 / GH13_26 / GH13_34 [uncultured Nocardioides sp.]
MGHMPGLNDPIPADRDDWWRHAVVYQVYVRSFADSDGDGVGDLPGITSRLPYLRELGVDALWVTPFYPSPQHDHGYDVADYRDVDPLFGSLADADELIATAHDLGLRVVVDLVPNHTSNEHEWFRAALAAGPGSPERARYLFRDSADGPPNNWSSVFGGPAWTQVEDGQWYLHLFDSTQPDLDWRNPEVPAMFEDVLRFWLDRGVDGFRVDVAHGLVKEELLRDQVVGEDEVPDATPAQSMVERAIRDEPMWDQPEVHDVYRSWHQILDEAGADKMAVAEAWTQTPDSMAAFVRPDELDQAFNFAWLLAPWSAASFAEVVTGTLAAMEPVGASPTWVLSNHDVVRHPTRYGGGARGLARARAATAVMLALPGSSYVYQGEELGLEQVDVAPEHRQDPSWFRTGEPGRDGCRVPIPWSGSKAPYGFGPGTEQPWIPQPDDWSALTAEAQDADPGSTLSFYRRALAARRELAWTAGETVELLDAGADVLAFRRGPLTVLLNCGSAPVALPDGEVLLSSGPLGDGKLPADTAVWLR